MNRHWQLQINLSIKRDIHHRHLLSSRSRATTTAGPGWSSNPQRREVPATSVLCNLFVISISSRRVISGNSALANES